MTYRINEIFYSIQGEGHWTGRPAVFVRFSGCNLWSGMESERAESICTFCDTNFVDYTEMSVADITSAVTDLLPDNAWDVRTPMVVFTGGEPMLQLDAELVRAMLSVPMYVAIETNGTKTIPFQVNWVCVSPKTPTIKTRGDELKLVYPQPKITPDMFDVDCWEHTWLSPMDGPNLQKNIEDAYRYCLAHPEWRLNLQTHKVIGVR